VRLDHLLSKDAFGDLNLDLLLPANLFYPKKRTDLRRIIDDLFGYGLVAQLVRAHA
jgi:hypothetical protein